MSGMRAAVQALNAAADQLKLAKEAREQLGDLVAMRAALSLDARVRAVEDRQRQVEAAVGEVERAVRLAVAELEVRR